MAQGRAERAAAHENKKLKLPQLQTRSHHPPTRPARREILVLCSPTFSYLLLLI